MEGVKIIHFDAYRGEEELMLDIGTDAVYGASTRCGNDRYEEVRADQRAFYDVIHRVTKSGGKGGLADVMNELQINKLDDYAGGFHYKVVFADGSYFTENTHFRYAVPEADPYYKGRRIRRRINRE